MHTFSLQFLEEQLKGEEFIGSKGLRERAKQSEMLRWFHKTARGKGDFAAIQKKW